MNFDLKKLFLSVAIGFSLMSGSVVQAMNLDDFIPPVSGGADKPVNEVSKSGDVVTAENMQDGLGYAYQELMEEGGQGILTVQTKTGMGVISSATTGYTRYENINATMLSKRGAYFKAFNEAQSQMVKYFGGIESDCASGGSTNLVAIDTGTDSLANNSSNTSEACKEAAQGMLAGYVTYSVNDNNEDDEVTISLASSTKTRGAVNRLNSSVITTEDPKKAFEFIVKEITLGVVPPMGAKLISDPVTGESIVIGFGSSIIRQNKDKKLMSKMTKMANDQSTMLANNSLVAFMNGSNVYWSGGFDESQVNSDEQFNVPVDQNGNPQAPVALDATRNKFLNELSQSNEFKSVTAGKLPAGVITKTIISEDGHWSNTIAVYRHSATAQANSIAAGTSGSAVQGRPINAEGGQAPGSANPKGPSGSVVRDNDF